LDVVGISIRNAYDPKSILGTQRLSNAQHYCNLWELPGGKIEPGETSLDCAIRQAWQGMGIILRPREVLSTSHYRDETANINLIIVGCDDYDHLICGEIQKLQIQAFNWFLPHEMLDVKKYKFCPADYHYIRLINE